MGAIGANAMAARIGGRATRHGRRERQRFADEARLTQGILAAGCSQDVARASGVPRCSWPPRCCCWPADSRPDAAGQTRRIEQARNEVSELRGELRGMREMVAMTLLQQDSAIGRLQGVSWSHQLERPSDQVLATLLETLQHDPNVNVRLASIDALRAFAAQDQRPHRPRRRARQQAVADAADCADRRDDRPSRAPLGRCAPHASRTIRSRTKPSASAPGAACSS